MGLTKTEQTEALTDLLTENYDAYARLVRDSRSISREQKIDLLVKGLALAGLQVWASSSDGAVQEARENLAHDIASDADVVSILRKREEA